MSCIGHSLGKEVKECFYSISRAYSKLNENISAMVRNMKLSDSLIEAGIDVDRAYFSKLDEAAQLKVTDEALTGMMKFITDKYNSLDFGEIEKSAGDITRFRYFNMILDNVETLDSIYEASVDPGASKYRDLLRNITTVLEHLKNDRSMYATLYKSGNGVVQLLYTSLVAACIYAIGTMVSNTIRFVTVEQDADCEVLFEEIPGSIRHVHFKNIQSCAKDVEKFHNYLVASSTSTGRAVNESVALTAVVAGSLIVGTILLIPRIIMMIREIIYSIYYTRVKLSEMLGMQAELVKTNIESLEAGRGKAKVIARQKKIVHKLEVWQNRVALRMDTTEALKRTQQKKEDSSLKIDSSRAGSEDPADALLI